MAPTDEQLLPHLALSGDQRREARADIEGSYNKKRLEIDERFQKSVATAEERKAKAHEKNLETRQDGFREAGLNPDGSEPEDRPDGFFRTGDERLNPE